MENKGIKKYKLDTKNSLDSPANDTTKNANNDINNNNSSTKENGYEYYYEEGVTLLVEAARRYRALREASLIDTNVSSSPLSASLLVLTKVKSPVNNSSNTRKKRRRSSSSRVGCEETELSLENSLTQSHSTETKNEKAQKSCNEELKNNEVEETNVITRGTEKIITCTEPTKSTESTIIAGGTNSLLCKQHASVILGLLDFYQ